VSSPAKAAAVRYDRLDTEHSIVSATAVNTDTMAFAMAGDMYTVDSIHVARPTQAICPVGSDKWASLEVSGCTTASSQDQYGSGDDDSSSDFRVGRHHHGSASSRGRDGTVAHSRTDSTLVLVLLCIVGVTHALSARLLR
jgi:hypothetical protein